MDKDKYFFEFPDGTVLKTRELKWPTLEILRDQCSPREISRIESTVNGAQFQPKEQGFMSGKCPFVDQKGAAPTPGKYKVILAENKEEIYEFVLCCSHLDFLKDNDPVTKARQCFGYDFQYELTNSNASTKYSLSVMNSKLVIALDFSAHFDKFLKVKGVCPPLNIEGNSFGLVSTQLLQLAQLLPLEMFLNMALSCSVDTIIITGSLWSGSIAHLATIMLRECCSSLPEGCTLTVKAVSFHGPLCVSPDLSKYLERNGQKENHTTINYSKDLSDRLIADFQTLSPLESCSVESWRFIYSTVLTFTKAYFSEDKDSLQGVNELTIASLVQAETNLKHHAAITSDNSLKPIGRYLSRTSKGEIQSYCETNEIEEFLSSCDAKKRAYKRQAFSLNDYSTDSQSLLMKNRKNYNVLPKIKSIRFMYTGQRVALHVTGENLDSVLLRYNDLETMSQLTYETIPLLPFRLKPRFTINSQSKLLSVCSSWSKAVIELMNCEIDPPGEIILRTDFGDSNPLQFTKENITKCEESAPSKFLHPTMNAEFLSSAMLRIAICCKPGVQTGEKSQGLTGSIIQTCLASNPRISELWKLLLDLEDRLIVNDATAKKTLESNLLQYLNDEIDISTMRNMSMGTFDLISKRTTEDYIVKEMVIFKLTRKSVAALGFLGGGLLALASALLFIPAMIIVTPIAYFVERSDLSLQARFGVNTVLGITGMLSLPGAIVGSIGIFLIAAAQYAAADYQSTKYKQMLKSLLVILGGNVQDIVDELPNLEDSVVTLFSHHFPGCDLSTCSVAAFERAIAQAISKGSEEASAINESLAKCSITRKIAVEKLLLVGRINAVRNILENNFMIGFIGVHNAGKSTTISQLFGCKTNPNLIERTEEPTCHVLGKWIDSMAQKSSTFRDWIHESNHSKLQLYAVDFPGTTDERLSVSTMTRYTAELASFFLVVLKAGHIAGPEKEVIQIARNNHKPFLVIINQCDTIAHEVSNPTTFEKLKERYAKVLEVPEKDLIFVSAFKPSDIDKLRAYTFGMLQNLIGNPKIFKTLPLHFVTDEVVEGLLNSDGPIKNIFETLPDRVSDAVASLLFSFIPLTVESISEATHKLNENYQASLMQSANKKKGKTFTVPSKLSGGEAAVERHDTHPRLIGKFFDMLRLIACQLDVDSDAYATVIDALDYRMEEFSATVPNLSESSDDEETLVDGQPSANTNSPLPSNISTSSPSVSSVQQPVEDRLTDPTSKNKSAVGQVYEIIVGLIALNSLCEKVSQYFGERVTDLKDNMEKLCPKVLLGMHLIFTTWVSRGYQPMIVKLATKSLLMSEERFDDSNLLQAIEHVKNTLLFAEATSTKALMDPAFTVVAHSPSNEHQAEGGIELIESCSNQKATTNVDDINFVRDDNHGNTDPLLEHERYQNAKTQFNLLRTLTFSTCDMLVKRPVYPITIEEFQGELTVFVKTCSDITTLELMPTNLAEELITALLALEERHLKMDLRFLIVGEAGIDVNGVTRAVLTKCAEIINENPERVFLKKDSDSGFLYFDPKYCYSTDPTEVNNARKMYRGLGRLIGLTLRKSTIGATLPINFPISFYKWLLQYRLSFSDLSIISPQIANSIQTIGLMDDLTLQEQELTFGINLDTKTVIELVPNGQEIFVNAHNRVEFLTELLQVYLCCYHLETKNPVLPSTNNDLLPTEVILGVQHLCPRDIFNQLSPISLQLVLEGNREISVSDWRSNTILSNNSSDNSRTIEFFWEVLTEHMNQIDLKRLLCFTVGTSTLPNGGFEALSPKFQLVIGGLPLDALPVSHTCFHMLMIPRYTSLQTMKEKLLLACHETDLQHIGLK